MTGFGPGELVDDCVGLGAELGPVVKLELVVELEALDVELGYEGRWRGR